VTESRGRRDVIAVLVLIEVAAGLLAALGQALLMASPLFLVVPVLKVVFLLVVSGRLVRGRRWAVVTMLVVHTLAIVGFGFGLVLGATPWFTASVTLTGLLTGLGVPLAVLWLCVGLLRSGPDRPALPAGPVAGSPWPHAAAPPAGALAGLPAAPPAGALAGLPAVRAVPAGAVPPAVPWGGPPISVAAGAPTEPMPLPTTRALPTEALR
jgi:hypothetical protein